MTDRLLRVLAARFPGGRAFDEYSVLVLVREGDTELEAALRFLQMHLHRRDWWYRNAGTLEHWLKVTARDPDCQLERDRHGWCRIPVRLRLVT